MAYPRGHRKGVPIVSIVEDQSGRILVANQHGLYEFIAPVYQGQSGQWRRLAFKLKPKQRHPKITG